MCLTSLLRDNVTPTFVNVVVPETRPCHLISWLLIEVTPSHVLLNAPINPEHHCSLVQPDQKRWSESEEHVNV